MMTTNRMVQLVLDKVVDDLLRVAKPIQAAAHLICYKQYSAAKSLLVSCGELDLAFACSRCFDIETCDILCLLIRQAERHNDFELAMTLICMLPGEVTLEEYGMILSRNPVMS